MIRQRVKHFFAVLFGLLGAATFVCGVVYLYTYLPVPKHTDDDPAVSIQSIIYADDPAMLYQTVGIKQCERDALYKIEETRAVLLKSDDLARVSQHLEGRFHGKVAAALYVNMPETGAGVTGSPALVALREEANGYCVLGVERNWNPELFNFGATYQPMLNQQQ